MKDGLLQGNPLNGVDPERPLGATSPLVSDVAKLLLSCWLAIVEAVAAMVLSFFFLEREDPLGLTKPIGIK